MALEFDKLLSQAVHYRSPDKTGLETGISEYTRRTPATNGGFLVFATRHNLIKFYGVLLLGSRKACRYLVDGYSRPIATPTLSTGIGSADRKTLLGGEYAGNLF